MSEKRLLQASVLLVRSLKLINKQDMLEIGAVADLRSYLIGQESVRLSPLSCIHYAQIDAPGMLQALREILIDELQSHLYLKSFWCESRWATYSPNQQSCMLSILDRLTKTHTTFNSS
jgi:exocyst complex component 4